MKLRGRRVAYACCLYLAPLWGRHGFRLETAAKTIPYEVSCKGAVTLVEWQFYGQRRAVVSGCPYLLWVLTLPTSCDPSSTVGRGGSVGGSRKKRGEINFSHFHYALDLIPWTFVASCLSLNTSCTCTFLQLQMTGIDRFTDSQIHCGNSP